MIKKKAKKLEAVLAENTSTKVSRFPFIQKLREKWANQRKKSKKWQRTLDVIELIMYTAWVWAAFMACQYIVVGILKLIMAIFGDSVFSGVNEALFQAILSLVVYIFACFVVIALPWYLLGEKTTRNECGLRGLLTWSDIGLGIVGFIVSMIAMVIVSAIVAIALPMIDMEQAQDVGFSGVSGFGELFATFLTLVVFAPVFEELLFRGWLYGKLRARTWALPAIILTAIVFGVAHGQANVAIVVGVMSVFMCLIREMTGTIWGGMIIHMLKNGMAFYMLFIL